MGRKLVLVFLAMFLVVAAFQNLAAADTYYVYNQWGGTWHDANKTWTGDTNLCWAAAASNILDWDKWGTATLNTESLIFNYFKGNWTNQGGLPQFGWEWWFDGINRMQVQKPAVTDWAQLTTSGGGNFWTEAAFSKSFHTAWYDPAVFQTTNLLAAMDSYLHSGYGVTLGIYKPNPAGGWFGHALTAWGFDYTSTYTRIYVTDSDDSFLGLKNYLVNWDATNGWWELEGGYTGWHLADVEALDRNVPIPTSLLLLGSGLLGLAGWRRKFCNN